VAAGPRTLERYPDATELTITADCGGSNSYRIRLWKTELQALATTPVSRSWCTTTRPGQASGTKSEEPPGRGAVQGSPRTSE
jgi:hypothetical protein